MEDFLPIFFLLPIALLIFKKNDFAEIRINKKIIAFLGIFLLLVPVPALFDEALAVNSIKQVIKIDDVYDADGSFQYYTIHPPLTDINKSFIFLTFSHAGENDNSDTMRSYEIINSTTFLVKGENTATGNIALEFNGYIVEYEGAINVQNLQRNTVASEAEGEKTETIPTAINLTNSFITMNGVHHNATETTVGNEELNRVRILSNTTWGWFVANTPNTGPQGNLVSIIDWNQDDIFVQRGILTLADQANTDTVSPATAIDRNRTILLVTYTNDFGTSIDNDDFMVRAELNTSGDIVFNRFDNEGEMTFAWELIEFPADFIKVHHDQVVLTGTLTATDTIPAVRDFDKSIVISTVGTPFGYSGGEINEAGTVGAIDRGMVDIKLTNEDEVTFERADATGTLTVNYQVIEFLEKEFPENPHSQINVLQKIIKLSGTFNQGNLFQDYTISPALNNINKTMIFMTMNSTFQDGSEENGKMWEIIDESTFRILGSGSGINDPAVFNAQIVEFNGTSPIFTQYDMLQFPESLSDGNRTMWISPVNTTNSFIIGQGSVLNGADPTFGVEEFGSLSLMNETQWSFESEMAQDPPETTIRTMITDFNQDDILVQRGTGNMTGLTEGISPPTVIAQNNTLFFVNYRLDGAVFAEFPNRTAINADLNSTGDIILNRNSTGVNIIYNWQTVTFPDGFLNVQHGLHSQVSGQFNETSTIVQVQNVSNAFAIGTVGEYYTQSMGSGSSNIANNFDDVFGLMTLESDDTLRFTRGNSNGSWDIGYQVVEFFFLATAQVLDFTASESIVVVDNFESNLTTSQDVTDLITIIDLFNTSLNVDPDLSPETITILDAYTNELSLSQTLPETITILDTFIGTLQFNQNMTAETVTILDAFSADLEGSLTLPEIITIVDTYTNQLTALQNFTDSISINDNFTPSKGSFQTLSETIIILDVFNAQIEGALSLAEVITIIDVFNITLDFMQDMAPETILITDVFTATLTADVINIETVDILDAFLATCATCQVPIPPTGNPNPPFGGGGTPSSPTPFGTSALVDLTVEDITIDVTPGEIIDLNALFSWNIDSEIQIIKFEPQRNKWFSTQLPVIEDTVGSTPNNGEIPFSFRLPVKTCQTQNEPQRSFNDQTCYESPFIQFPITVSGVADGRLSTDTATITIKVQSAIEIPLIYYIVFALMVFAVIIAWWIGFGRRKHDKEGDRSIRDKHTKKQHNDKELRKIRNKKQRNISRKQGSLKNRLNSRDSLRRTQRPDILRKRKSIG